MHQPKNLHLQIEYASEALIPEVDIELNEFIKVLHEHLDAHMLHEELFELNAKHIGESVLITENIEINEHQFENQKHPDGQNSSFKKSIIKKLFN